MLSKHSKTALSFVDASNLACMEKKGLPDKPSPIFNSREYITTQEDDMSFTLFFDGACRGNPGPMAIGAVLLENGKKVKELCENIGRGTNNIAEWNALIGGLKLALAHGCRELEVRGDSQLVIRQISGKYQVKSENLIPLFNEAKKLCAKFEKINFKWVEREDNSYTDGLSNKALDMKN
ncbi:MAG: ribonuclease HI family protein [Candidatus Methanoperedens sp.]